MAKKKSVKDYKHIPVTKLSVGIPSTGTVEINTAYSLAGLMFILGSSLNIQPMLTKTTGIGVAEARNQIVMEAQRQNMDRLLFIDTDMAFPHDAYHVLAKHMGDSKGEIKIIGCNYPKRDGTGIGVSIGMDEKRLTGEESGLVEVMGIGGGLLLIDMSVFDKIEKPYFHHQLLPEKVDEVSPGSRAISEDFYFCNKVRTAGERVWCDTDLSRHVGHVGSTTFFLNRTESK